MKYLYFNIYKNVLYQKEVDNLPALTLLRDSRVLRLTRYILEVSFRARILVSVITPYAKILLSLGRVMWLRNYIPNRKIQISVD